MPSWILAVGDELLSGHVADGNSHWLARRLRRTPHPVTRIVVVPDEIGPIASELMSAAAGPAERVFCCGGLGPTPDDRTMAGVARFLEVELVQDEAVLERIRARARLRFEQGRAQSPDPNPGTLKMALIPKSAEVLPNPVGGAPPLLVPLEGGAPARWLFVLPGVPAELQAIFQQVIEPHYLAGGGGRSYREQYFAPVPESRFFPALTELELTHPGVRFGSYPQPQGGVIIRASAIGEEALGAAFLELRRLFPEAFSD
ncbi:MAG: competence/damage-inducible protein A [Candidatus Dormibacteria bacterium]